LGTFLGKGNRFYRFWGMTQTACFLTDFFLLLCTFSSDYLPTSVFIKWMQCVRPLFFIQKNKVTEVRRELGRSDWDKLPSQCSNFLSASLLLQVIARGGSLGAERAGKASFLPSIQALPKWTFNPPSGGFSAKGVLRGEKEG
jgi:hypothetical protein